MALHFFLALLPVALLFSYIYWRDHHEPEPLGYLILTFVLGILSVVPTVLVGGWVGKWLHAPHDSWLHAFVGVALVEEAMKFWVLRGYNYRLREFDEPYDGIMYAVAASLGFAALENVLYVFGSDEGLRVALIRMFTAVPAHAVFGVMMGYFAGLAKFAPQGLRTWLLATGLLVAVLLHGGYDYFLFQPSKSGLAGYSLVLLILGVSTSIHALRNHKAHERAHRGGH